MKKNKRAKDTQVLRMLAAMLLLALLLSAVFAPAALADEGAPYTGGMEILPGWDETPDLPTDDPASEPPDYSDPSDPSDPSDVSDPWGGETSSDLSSSDEGSDGPWEDDPDDNTDEDTNAATHVNPNPTPRRSNANIERPRITLNASTSSAAPSASTPADAPVSSGPNYVTFARLNQRHNSMSLTLFYGGAGCIFVGVLGLILIVIFYIHGRHVDERDGIFEEIAEAEHRYPRAYPPHQPRTAPPQPPVEAGYAPARESLYTEGPDALSQAPAPGRVSYTPPAQDSLYTEEFDALPRTPAPRRTEYAAPAQDSLYTEEFTIPAQPAARQSAPARQAPPQATRPVEAYDTEEILRELLHGGSK